MRRSTSQASRPSRPGQKRYYLRTLSGGRAPGASWSKTKKCPRSIISDRMGDILYRRVRVVIRGPDSREPKGPGVRADCRLCRCRDCSDLGVVPTSEQRRIPDDSSNARVREIEYSGAHDGVQSCA